ncbi:MAG TPA: FIST N-terminal domain-containing protein, partial [Stellaceae bacterium]|nr:FIST N-terminal domain-containing protein [Stellaceae bacterium]
MSGPFAAAFAAGDPETLATRLLAQLPTGQGANLGILYVSEPAAVALPLLVQKLAEGSGIASWVGGVGLGVCAARQEVHDSPAAAVMTATLPPDGFRLFGATDDPAADLPRQHSRWIETVSPTLALVHGDPRCADLTRATVATAAASGAFLVGGLVSHRCPEPLLAGEVTAG